MALIGSVLVGPRGMVRPRSERSILSGVNYINHLSATAAAGCLRSAGYVPVMRVRRITTCFCVICGI